MRRLTHQEIVELARTDIKSAITEAKINMDTDPSNGAWVGLYIDLVERQ